MIARRWVEAGLVLPTIAALVGLCVLCGLGSWQVQRLVWKRHLIAEIGDRARAPALDNSGFERNGCGLPVTTAADGCEFRRVALRGRFHHDVERHVFIALAPKDGRPFGPGYWIFTPFSLAAPASGVLYVNRGFVPAAEKALDRRSGSQIGGEVTVEGVVRRPEPRSWFSAENDPRGNVWFVRSPLEFEGAVPRSGIITAAYVDQSGPTRPGQLPFPVASAIELSNRHLEYAVTWFGLAGTLAGVFAVYAHSRLKTT